MLIGKGSVSSIYAKPQDSLATDYPRNEGRLANRFFPRNVLWMFLWDPTVKRQYPKFPSPHPKRNDFFSDWVGLFEVCFRSSKNAKLKSTTNYPLQSRYSLGARETSQDKTPSSQTSIYPNLALYPAGASAERRLKSLQVIHTDFFRTSKSQISNHHLRSYHCHHHCLLSGPLVVHLNRPGRYLLPV